MEKAIILMCAALPLAALCAESLPDPYKTSDAPILGPAPTPVMEQVFWVQLNVPPDVEVKAVAPEGVRLLDKTKPGKGRTRTRLYFRSDRGVKDASIAIEVSDREVVSVPLRVLSYREDIEEKTKAVPGVDPSARKRGRSYYTAEKIEVARRNLKDFPALGDGIKRADPHDAMSDEQMFACVPSWNVPRQCYSNWPCPHCGEAIYKTSGFYPWQRSSAQPFKAQCPLCKKFFPTNDITKDDFTSGEYPDDGWGWDPGSGRRDEFAGWVGYYNHHVPWYWAADYTHRMALRYMLFGDEEAAHRAGVLLCRMAYVYPGMDMRWQQVRTKYSRPGRLFVDGNWERNGVLVPLCRAYDAIWERIGNDTRLAEFLGKKDSAIRSPDDVKALIETYLIQVFGWDWVRRGLSGGSMGAREEDMAQFAVCADMGPVSERWLEEIFTHAYNSGTDKGGFDDENLVNTLNREGPTLVSALGYAVGYLGSKSDMAEILSQVTSPRWKGRCNLYDPVLYPKLRAEYDAWLDFLVAGQFGPGYGDSGNPLGERYPKGIPVSARAAYERAYGRWPTDRLARAIFVLGKKAPELFEEDVWPRVEAQAKQAGPEPPARSRVLDGAGFVFLESRPSAPDLNKRAGIALRYGYGHGHHHQDNLNIEMFAKGLSIAPELGYPCWAHPMGNTGHVAHHNTGMIDGLGQYAGAISRGDLEMFACAPEASFADVSAQPSGFPNRAYRRAVCLADAPGDNVYLFDVLRLAGGATRTYCFHSPPQDDFQSNLSFQPRDDALKLNWQVSGYKKNIVEPQAATSDGDVWGDWKYEGKSPRLRVHLLGHPQRRYIAAKCAKPDIPPIRYLFAEDEAKDGASEFVALWQPYEGKPFIEGVERLPVEGARAGEFQPVAVRVTLSGGQADTFLYTHDPETPLRCGGLEFRGSFGYWSEREGKLRTIHLVNGDRLCRGAEGITAAPAAFRAKITGVDYLASAITLDRKVPSDMDLKGQLAYIRAGNHRTAYHIAEVLPSGDAVRLDLSAIIFRSRMTKVGEDRKHIVCELSPPIETSRGFKPGYYDGAALTGEDRKTTYRVVGVKDDQVLLDRQVDEKDFPDADGDGRRMVSIYDMGPGDEVGVYGSVFKRLE